MREQGRDSIAPYGKTNNEKIERHEHKGSGK